MDEKFHVTETKDSIIKPSGEKVIYHSFGSNNEVDTLKNNALRKNLQEILNDNSFFDKSIVSQTNPENKYNSMNNEVVMEPDVKHDLGKSIKEALQEDVDKSVEHINRIENPNKRTRLKVKQSINLDVKKFFAK